MANEIQELKFQVGEAWKGVYSSSTAYGLANVVQDPTGLSIYRSLKSGNVGHPLSNASWWFRIIDLSSIKAESDRIAALNQSIAQDEALRVAAEELRQQHEAERVAAETQRDEAEQARISAEQQRVNKESQREAAEQQRISAEQGRVSAESARVQAEQARVLAETLRANAEDQRAANEQNRIAAEQQRIERAESDHTRAESDHAAYVDSLGAFDISSYHATDGVLAKYADLAAALGTNGANIPDTLRKGGMSVKFVQSSDNKYVQFRCMAQNFTTDVTQWQGVDKKPISGSNNIVESDGIFNMVSDAAKNSVHSQSINPSDFTWEGFYNRSTGNFQPNSYFVTSELIPLEGIARISGSLRCYLGNVATYVFFDSTQNPIGFNAEQDATEVQAIDIYEFPTNAAYVRFTCNVDYFNQFNVDIITYTSVLNEVVTDVDNIGADAQLLTSYVALDADYEEGYFKTDGTWKDVTNFRTKKYSAINLKRIKGTLYVPSSTYYTLCFLDSSGSFISAAYELPASSDYMSIDVLSIPTNAKYIAVTVGTSYIHKYQITLTYQTVSYKEGGEIDKIYKTIENVAASKWAGKTVLMFGDSFVDFGRYPNAIAEKLQCNIINKGVGGSTIVKRASTTDPKYCLYSRLYGYEGQPTEGKASPITESCDLIIIHGGINDFARGRTLGTMGEGTTNPLHVYSAIHCILKWFMEHYPTTPVVWGTPCHIYKPGAENDWEYDQNGNFVEQSIDGITLRQIANAIKEVCAIYSVPVIDYYSMSGIIPQFIGNRNAYTSNQEGVPDGLHPSDAGAKKMADIAAGVLELL